MSTSQDSSAEFNLLRYSTGDALHFVFQNGVRRKVNEEGASPLPGLSKVVELQEKQAVRDKVHTSGTTDDPLDLKNLTHVGTHEEWCAHSQTACALAKNAVAQCLQRRSEVRVRRYGEAVMQLSEAFPTLRDTEEQAPETAADTPYVTTASSTPYCTSSAQDHTQTSVKADKSAEAEASLTTDDEASDVAEEEEEEELETYLLQHPTFGADMAAAWLRRRYLRCCNVINVRPSAAVCRRFSRCVQATLSSTLSSFSAEQKAVSPLSPDRDTPTSFLCSPGGRTWMSFPGTMVLLRELRTVPYEVNVDFSGCAEIGHQPRHFIALLGVLEGCRNTVVSLNVAKTCLSDDEVRVLCLFCRAYLRRLQVLDLSGNKRVTDKVAVWIKQLAASSPLLFRLTVRGTSLSRSTMRSVAGILCRKAL
ncbi:hypothetical protein, unknown function [Leishmania mexicana MHOM/GT/2001/U1103]|uniref:Uncharacterized protein n=1 Tax=Leishmania mexicana (strain MHOM/GT/2001/U1103) TaxID=929439 RepID=E9B588_LEIMU|nr:hypothetical protein, unknown function [Leishmania mexicana MHOM/GT/2001/U1103]CBZ30408.1 hypothetical protein, unknown function [Leishmania mexicana MHOM/GT/2001/U1103]